MIGKEIVFINFHYNKDKKKQIPIDNWNNKSVEMPLDEQFIEFKNNNQHLINQYFSNQPKTNNPSFYWDIMKKGTVVDAYIEIIGNTKGGGLSLLGFGISDTEGNTYSKRIYKVCTDEKKGVFVNIYDFQLIHILN